MSFWTKAVIGLFVLLQTIQLQAQQANEERAAIVVEEEETSERFPRRLVFTNKDWDLTEAYSDVFKILSEQNTCSNFYRGPRVATTVLNEFVMRVNARSLVREISFQMVGRTRLIRNPGAGGFYRLFDHSEVNTNGSFYQRRPDPMHKFPSDVGNFGPGTRPARALILLHELGHLIQDDDGAWLIPDDGRNGPQSKANTLRVQQACQAQLKTLN